MRTSVAATRQAAESTEDTYIGTGVGWNGVPTHTTQDTFFAIQDPVDDQRASWGGPAPGGAGGVRGEVGVEKRGGREKAAGG
ncbi:MAG: hypothetical protein OXH66_01505, partial [Gemmatimonadetes bacterium]|nr:hypothetical protein [Gemmatimonadota bacterium]